MITRNVDLLETTMAWIEANPEIHNQKEWFTPKTAECGAACCFAGNAAILAGAQPPDHLGWGKRWGVRADGSAVEYSSRTHRDGVEHISAYAARILGLDEDEADALFESGKTVTTLRRLVDHLKAGGTIDEDGDLWLHGEIIGNAHVLGTQETQS